MQPHAFEEPRYFEGCLPIEVMAERGPEVLAYGPMKPVGLEDPRTGRRPHAVIQLRREDAAGTAWNLVGFQTRLTWPEQRRIFRAFVPGLAQAEFVRLGQIHRNTFVDAPRVLSPDLSVRAAPHLFLAGQITGVEGYVESAAAASWRRAPCWTGWRAAPSSRRRRRPPWGPCTDISPARPIRRGTITSRPTSSSPSSPRSPGATAARPRARRRTWSGRERRSHRGWNPPAPLALRAGA